MSLKATCKTQIDDQSDLVTALEDIYGKRVRVVEAGVDVRGYAATQRPSVLVEIDGLIGTAGYYKNDQGKYTLVYDNMDARRLKDIIPQKDKKGNILDRLAQSYSKVKVARAVKQLRGTKVAAESLDEDGNYKIRLRVTAY